MLAVDTETTGIDIRHGARPFFVTTCTEVGQIRYWEWTVDPLTRQPEVPEKDLDELAELLSPNETGQLVLHNSKFDVSMLATLRPEFGEYWRWEDTLDTLLMAHLLYSNRPKNLTDLGIMILGHDITKHEVALKEACLEARRFAKKYPGWRLAKKDEEDMPSAKETVWKFDTWLPRRIAIEEGYPEDHPWWTVLSTYANADSELTVALAAACLELVRERKLEKLLGVRLKLLPIIYRMEAAGITLSKERLDELQVEYKAESEKAERICTNIARDMGVELTLPKSGNNKSLMQFCFGHAGAECEQCGRTQAIDVQKAEQELARLRTQPDNPRLCNFCKEEGKHGVIRFDVQRGLNLPIVGYTDTGNPSLNKGALETYLGTLEPKSKQYLFMSKLQGKRKRDTALSYMEGYERFWLPLVEGKDTGWYVLHPRLNPTGTDTLRFSSSNPNEQNISKQEGFNLRYMFGPGPGREWWSCDAKNIELRLPAYESKEQELINLFEQPDLAPYYGSTHLLNFHTVYPDIWEKELKEVGLEKVGPYCKKKYASSYYQWCKNGGFAVQYGAIDRIGGTADIAFHRNGSHALLKQRFSKLEALNRKCIKQAEHYGYVETIPDKTVDPERGYPLLCTRTEYGKILPTVPLNYHIQGSAMWWMIKAMIRVQEQLDTWREQTGFDGFMTMQVHDELVFDFPKSKSDPKVNPKNSNLWRIRRIQQLMEMSGDDFGMPTPTSCEYHPNNWSEGISL